MSRPPIKAMEAVKRYCKKKKTCDGCPLYGFNEFGYILCSYSPDMWEIKKENENHCMGSHTEPRTMQKTSCVEEYMGGVI